MHETANLAEDVNESKGSPVWLPTVNRLLWWLDYRPVRSMPPLCSVAIKD
jgi:hypothetical protein